MANTKFLSNQALLDLDRIVAQYRRLTDPNIGSGRQRSYLPWLATEPTDMMSCCLVAADPANAGALARWDEYEPATLIASGPRTIAALLEAHADALEFGTGPLLTVGGDVPGTIHGCLVWDNPEQPFLMEPERWTPLR
ncbi:hypothetical protein ACWD6R_21105 [Streptomyces sp. NPDC005151]